jgi:hypothetical protein
MQGVLRDPNIPADKLDALWRMRKELLAEEHREAFDAAFAAMAAELPQVRRDGTVELVKDGKRLGLIKFARWEDMDKVIRPIMARYGFALTFTTAPADANGKLLIRGELMREGHSRIAEIPLPPDVGPGRNSLQAVGSAISYGKRYLAEMLLNIVRCGEDDDGNGAVAGPVTAEQAAQLAKLTAELNETEERFLGWSRTGAKTFAEIPAREFVRLLNALNAKKRSAPNGNTRTPGRGGATGSGKRTPKS